MFPFFSHLWEDEGWVEGVKPEEVEIDYSPSCIPSSSPYSSSSSSSSSSPSFCFFGNDTSYSYVHGVEDDIVEGFFVFLAFLPLIILCLILLFRKGKMVILQEYQTFVDRIRGNQEAHGERIRREGDAEGECPICLDVFDSAVVTNCNHIFCGACILDFWELSSIMGALTCPLCRRRVTLLQPWRLPDEPSPIQGRIDRFNRRMSGNASLIDRIRDIPSLLGGLRRNLSWRVIFRTIFVLKRLLFFLGGFLYIFSPVDLIPENLFGLVGLIDDLFAVILIIFVLSECFRNFLLQRERQR